jgi:putative PIN family toxin of toxin-antitoxin system
VTWITRRWAKAPPKPRVVLDTNVLVSALVPSSGAPAEILRRIEAGRIDWLVSPSVRREIELVLAKDDLRGPGVVSADAKARLRWLLQERAIVVPNTPLRRPVCEHEADDKFLAAAVAGRAHCLVSDDRHLLRLHRFRSIKILSSSRFLAKLVTPY